LAWNIELKVIKEGFKGAPISMNISNKYEEMVLNKPKKMVCPTKLRWNLKIMERRMKIIGEGLIPTQLGENLQITKK
jgi:hypothetical protein